MIAAGSPRAALPAVLMLVLAPVALAAGAGAARAAPAPRAWYEEVAVNGFLESSYSYNFDRPDTRRNALRVFDFDDNTFQLGVAELVVQRAVAKPREAGFRVDLEAGGSIPRVAAAAGLFRDPVTGAAQDVDLQQAFASYVVPIGSGLRVDAGKFVTAHGAEVIEGYDGWNDNATRSLLFGFAIPFTHTGVRASRSFGPRVAATLMVVNGWDNATDNNRAKSVGGQIALTPNSSLALYLNGMTGAERSGSNADLRSLFDLVATLRTSPRLNLGLNLDLAAEQGAVPAAGAQPARTARWSGIAGYARLTTSARTALSVRAEGFHDRDGARTGTPQSLGEITLTPELRVTPRFLLRADLRTDWSNRAVFEREGRAVKDQSTALLSVLAWF